MKITHEDITESIAFVQGMRNFHNLMQRSPCFILSTHINPDGDGLGSQIALHEFLKAQGKRSIILNQDETPLRYRFLDTDQEIQLPGKGKINKKLLQHCAWIILDANLTERTGQIQQLIEPNVKEVFYIDHHVSPADHAKKFFNLEQATSTGEIVYYIFHHHGEQISYKSAQALYTSILTDTGSFRFPKTDWKTHRIVADLLRQGVSPSAVYQEVYENASPGRILLIKYYLNNLDFHFQGRLAFSFITDEILTKANSSNEETDGLVNMPLEGRGVRVSILVKTYGQTIKVAFRSKGAIDVASIASSFGGGGHFNAAGATLSQFSAQQIDAIKQKILHKFKGIL